MIQDTAKPTAVPATGYTHLEAPHIQDERIDKENYQHQVGNVLYAMIQTRPDIAFTTGRLSQFMSDPAKQHATGMKHLLRYIRSTAALRLRYGPGQPHVLGFADSDYAADKTDRKSILGYIFTLAGGAVSWRSRKQRSVATSTTEAEYMAQSSCVKHAL